MEKAKQNYVTLDNEKVDDKEWSTLIKEKEQKRMKIFVIELAPFNGA